MGANPLASNGSMWTVPDFKGKAKALQARGGKLVVIDPRRTETAAMADAHHFIRPGADVFLLAAMVHTLFAEAWCKLGRVAPWVNGARRGTCAAVAALAPEAVATALRHGGRHHPPLARELAARPGGGVCPHWHLHPAYGTLASWLVDVLNTLTGHLDRRRHAVCQIGGLCPTRRANPARAKA
jgi:anaerobic selenocysteine-containing dehydrogenase